jgi:hypothetical protein
MQLKKVLLAWALLLPAWPVLAQVETKPIQVRTFEGEVEEYNVLVTDKKVRQGSYVRYRPMTFAGLAVMEAGGYDHGLKEGEWRVFSQERPWNCLLSKGTYHAGVPEGMWAYYHFKLQRGGPFGRGNSQAATATPNGADPKTGYSVSITDTTAALQAQGLYAHGKRVGVWVYFDRQGQVIQKIDHFGNQLLYWRPETGPVVSGVAAASHPALYLGGKERLKEEIYHSMDSNFNVLYGAAKSGVVEFVFAVDAAGQRTGVSLATKASPTRYEKLLLAALDRVPATWLPQAAGGQLVAAEYRVRITTRAEASKDGNPVVGMAVEPLGE